VRLDKWRAAQNNNRHQSAKYRMRKMQRWKNACGRRGGGKMGEVRLGDAGRQNAKSP
jgi:hypothetical protein